MVMQECNACDSPNLNPKPIHAANPNLTSDSVSKLQWQLTPSFGHNSTGKSMEYQSRCCPKYECSRKVWLQLKDVIMSTQCQILNASLANSNVRYSNRA